MKVKFNKFERVAGLFVLSAIVGAIAITVGVAIEKGWFASKVKFYTTLESADGLHAGTLVQVSGLRAGSVTDVDLVSANEVKVQFNVLERFRSLIKEDSRVQVIRPFVIGEKVLDVTVGSTESQVLAANSEIESKLTIDVMDLLSGRKLAPFLGTMEALLDNLKVLAKAFSDPQRTKKFVEMFDQTLPLVKNLNRMSLGVIKVTHVATRKKRLEQLMSHLTAFSESMSQFLPIMAEEGPVMAEQLPQLVSNLTELTEEFKKLTPAISEVAPELPRASRRAIEALDEVVVTLKAMQKTFLLSGNVEDVREEEQKKSKEARQPAGQEKK